MEQVGLNLIADLYSDKNSVPVATGDPSHSMFRNLLERSTGGSKGGSSSCEERRRSDVSEEKANSGTLSGSLESVIQRIGLPISQLKLPRSAIPELMSLLEMQGLQRSEIHSLIASLSDKDGSIRMDKLLGRLQWMDKKTREGNGLLLDGKEIPQIGEGLMALGLGMGKIKEIIESSLNAKGELSIERFTSALAQISPGLDAKSLLSSILERAQIQARQKTEARSAADPDVQKLLQELSGASVEDAQKKIKEEIGRLMGERGIPPQEVKSFLETLTPAKAGAMVKKTQAVDPDGKKTEADAKGLMEKVVLDSSRKAPHEDGSERILQQLQKEKGAGKGAVERSRFPEEAMSKQNPAEQGKVPEMKTRPGSPVESLLRASETKGKPVAEQPEGVVTRKERTAETKPAPVREGVTADLSAVRMQKEAPEVVATHRAKETVALPEPLPKILDRMLFMIQGGEQKGRIQISPPELGRLDLDLVIKNGHLQAQLSAESPQVKDLLDANLNQLKQHLADVGLIVDRFEVSVGLEQNPFAREQEWTASHRRDRSSAKEREEDVPLRAERLPVGRPDGTLSQVDVLV